MEKINYGKILEKTLKELRESGKRPSLLLHACCAPCSSYVLEYLYPYFDITLLYYNPNISPESEYVTRSAELVRLVDAFKKDTPSALINVVAVDYNPAPFSEVSKGREALAEGGARCIDCYHMRLEYAAKYGKEHGFDYFCTTLSISPHKNASALNSIGAELSEEYGIPYLFSDFKKNGGYLRSCELSKKYGLYRQNYCGCVFSKENGEKSF